ncbi:hypothetical protein OG417_25255 [Actinoallomurus sp. NBC_01490]|uniref:hypothetical protein n=1 Tax=Actinoallomurus sp. NBC_01490 TaxID=2903557 RepID=UPI002E30C53A|nr:hypothetical protein [Actinoallomurus sp. NBC_01490]
MKLRDVVERRRPTVQLRQDREQVALWRRNRDLSLGVGGGGDGRAGPQLDEDRCEIRDGLRWPAVDLTPQQDGPSLTLNRFSEEQSQPAAPIQESNQPFCRWNRSRHVDVTQPGRVDVPGGLLSQGFRWACAAADV